MAKKNAVIGNPSVVDVYEDATQPTLSVIGKIKITDPDQGEAAFQTTVKSVGSTLGTLTLNADGTYKYSVDDSKVQYLGAGDTKVDTFTITSLDSTTKQVSFTIHGTNDAAVIGTPTQHDVTEDATRPILYAIGTVSISDADQGEAAFRPALLAGSGNLGTLVIGSNGAYIYAVLDSAVQYLGAGDTRVDTFTLTSLDGTTKQVSFTIHGVNDAAVIGTPTIHDVTEDVNVSPAGNLTASGTISISDADQNQSSFQTTVVAGPNTLGHLTIAANGAYTYTVSNAAVQYLNAGQTKVDTFTVTAFDGTTKQVAFTIHGAAETGNHAPSTPVDANAAANTIAEGAAAGSTVGLTASSTDVDGQAVTYSLTGDTSHGGFTINAATGVVTVADPTKIDFESSGASHTYTITAQASDGTLASSQTFTIVVTDVAPSTPVDSDGAANQVAQNASVGTYTGVTASSTDVNGPAVTYSIVGDTSNGGFAVDPSTGKVTIADSTKIAYNAATPSFDVTVQASDGTDTSHQTFTIGVLPNTPPVAKDDSVSATEAGGLNNTVPGHDPSGNVILGTGDAGSVQDTDAQNPSTALTVVAVHAGAEGASTGIGTVNSGTIGLHGTLTLNTDGSYTYVVNQNDAQVQALHTSTETLTDQFNYTISDTGGLQDTATLTVTIHGSDDLPQAAADTGTMTEDDAPTSFNVIANDHQDPDHTASNTITLGSGGITVTGPSGETFVNTDATASIVANQVQLTLNNAHFQQLALGESATITVPYTLTGDTGETSSANLVVTVNGVNDVPVAVDDSGSMTEDQSGHAFTVLTNDTLDADHAAPNNVTVGTIQNLSVPAGENIDVTDVSVSVNGSNQIVVNLGSDFQHMKDGESATFDIPYTLHGDQAGDTSTATLHVTVNGVNDPAVITDPQANAVTEDATMPTLSVSGQLSVNDVDHDQSAFSTAVTPVGNNLGHLTITSDGYYTYSVDNSLVQSLAAGEDKVETFTISSVDNTPKNISFTIHGAQDAPSLTVADTQGADDAASIPLSISVHLVDDSGTLSTVSIEGIPSEYTLSTGTPNLANFFSDGEGGGHWEIPASALSTLALVPGADARASSLTLTVSVASIEGGHQSSTTDTMTVTVAAGQGEITDRGLDGYIAGAFVFADANGNGVFDTGEASATTALDGTFTLHNAHGTLIMTGGTDISTGIAFTGTLKAPEGSTVVTPLTTLVTSIVSATANTAQPVSAADAAAQVAAALGLDHTIDITTFDPVPAAIAGNDPAATAVFAAGVQVQSTVAQISAVGAPATDVFSAIANAITTAAAATDPAAKTVDLSTHDTVAAIVSDSGVTGTAADAVTQTVSDANGSIQNATDVTTIAQVGQVAQGAAATQLATTDFNDPAAVQHLTDTYSGAGLQTQIASAVVPDPNATPISGTSGNDVLNGGDLIDTIDGLAGNDQISGGAGDDLLFGSGGNDRIAGNAGNDHIDGGAGFDRALYTDATGGITVNMAQGTASGAGVDSDILTNVEGIVGSAFADHYDATGFKGDSGIPGTPVGFNEFEGGAGDDTVIGTINAQGAYLTRVSYAGAAAGVTVDLILGTADGADGPNGSVGHDTFGAFSPGIISVWGSKFNDTISGTNNPFGTVEVFVGFAGDDTIDGRGGFDRIDYNQDPTTTTGLNINLASGTITGDASIGTDTLRSIEAIRGTNFADTYNAQGFSGTSANAGSFGTFNEFTGNGGNDTIIGNGNTRIGFNNATAGVTVDLQTNGVTPHTGTPGTGTADGDASVGHDTFSGVNAVQGSMFDDTIYGSDNTAATETFTGNGGNDYIDGRGGFDIASYNNIYLSTGGIHVDMGAGIVTGDNASIGTDTLRSIEGIQGTVNADVYDASDYAPPAPLPPSANTGNNGSFNQFEGLGGDDTITGNGNTRVIYANAFAAVTVNLALGTAFTTGGGDAAAIGTDTITGGVNSATGSAFNDTLIGNGNSNTFIGGAGSDTIDGGGSGDIAVFSGPRANYTVTTNGAGQATVKDNVGTDGTDTLTNIEVLQFSDTNVLIASGDANNPVDLSDNRLFFGPTTSSLTTGPAVNNDFIKIHSGLSNHLIDLGGGDDTVILGVTGGYTLKLANVEHLVGSAGNDFVNLLNNTNGLTVDMGAGNNDGLQLASGANSISVVNVEQISSADGSGGAALSNDTLNLLNNVTGVGVNLGLGTNILNLATGTNFFTNISNVDTVHGTASDDTLIVTGGVFTPNPDLSIDLGAGNNDTFQLGGQGFNGALNNVEHFVGSSGNDFYTLTNDQNGLSVDLGDGNDNLMLANGTNSISLTNVENVQSADFSGAASNDTLTLQNNVSGVSVDLHQGTNTLNLFAGSNSFLGITDVDTIKGTASDDTLTVIGGASGAFFTPNNDLSVDLGGGNNDTVQFGGLGLTIALTNVEHFIGGSDNNFFTLTNDQNGLSVDLGDGNDNLVLATGTNSVSLTNVESVQSADFSGAASNDTLTLQNNVSGLSVDLHQGTNTLNLAAGTNSITAFNVQQINGSASNDVLTMLNDAGGDTIDLGGGYDTLNLAWQANGVTVKNVENVIGSSDNDAITIANTAGTTTVTGGGGADVINASAATDVIRFTSASDSSVATGIDTVNNFDAGLDTFQLAGVAGLTGPIHFMASGVLDGTVATPQSEAILSGNQLQIDVNGDGTIGAGDITVTLNGLTGALRDANFSIIYSGDSGDNTLNGTEFNDRFQGFAGNDTINGGDGFDRAIYADATGGMTFTLGTGNVTGPGVGTDTLTGIEGIIGTNSDDTFTAAGFAGVTNIPGTPIGFNEFEGMGGNDQITGTINSQGAALTRVSYVDATAGVTVNLALGTADGDASVGHDTFTNTITNVFGSNFADTLTGASNGFGTVEVFDGRGGNDTINGGGGFDRADYNNDARETSGITVNLAAGTVTGSSVAGNDTLISVEAVRGTNFADTYNAGGFNGASTNAGSLGTFNEFTGNGGNDTIIGNGNTRISFNNATAGVTVDLQTNGTTPHTGTPGTGTADGDASVGHDTFSGVNAVQGSMYADTIFGSDNTAATETFTGNGGNDFIDGRGGFDIASYNNIYLSTGGISVNMGAGTVIGDSSIGTDTLRSIEGIQGTVNADIYDASTYGQAGASNVGNNGLFNQFEGLGGNDTITGNGNTRLIYVNAQAAVTVDLSQKTAFTTGGGDAAAIGTDTIISGVNSATGSAFGDTLIGDGVSNTFTGGAGNDTIDGGGSGDIAIFSGPRANYTVTTNGAGQATVKDNVGTDGTDTLTNIEVLQFSDTNVLIASGDANNPVDLSDTRLFFGPASSSLTTGPATNDDYIKIHSGLSNHLIDLGGGNDTVILGVSGGYTLNLANVEHLIGSVGDDFVTLVNNANGLTVDLGAAVTSDILTLAGGANSLSLTNVEQVNSSDISGAVVTSDVLTLQNNVSGLTVNLGQGTNTLNLAAGTNSISTFGVMQVNGSASNDVLTLLNGGAGDTIDLGAGSDTLNLTVAAAGGITVNNVENVNGSAGADVITIANTAGITTVTGGGGADFITASAAPDVFRFTSVSDSSTATGVDTVNNFDATLDTFQFAGVAGLTGPIHFAGSSFDGAVQPEAILQGNQLQIDVNGDGTSDMAVTLNGLTGTLRDANFSVIFSGDSGDNTLTGTAVNDRFQGFAGNDTINGGDGFDRAIYTDATGGMAFNFASVTGPGVGTDTLTNIEGIIGTNFDDTFTAAGFNGNTNLPGTPIGFNEFEGMGGNDIITGAINNQGAALTRVSYVDATSGVTVNLATGADGDASVGHDTFTNTITNVWGSNFADTLTGTNNGFGTVEVFEGRGGNDVINGGGGFDRADYNNDAKEISGITVNLAAGTVTGSIVAGNDTLISVEAVRGTNFADSYNATGFGAGSINAGSLGTFNEFTGAGGNDTITGNGNTRISFNNATAGVTVDLQTDGITPHTGTPGTGTADGDASVGHDTFTGVNAVQGSMYADTIFGSDSSTTETFTGNGGNDTIDGRGGFDIASYNNIYLSTGSITVNMGAGSVIGDSSIGTDTLKSIEGIQGTVNADTYDASTYGQAGALNVGNFGTFNQFEGLGGDDSITGNFNTRAMYINAQAGVAVTFGAGGTGNAHSITADDAHIGNDTFAGGVNSVTGSSFADTLDAHSYTGPNNNFNTIQGFGGDDTIIGNGNTQIFFNNASDGVTINMAAGQSFGTAANDVAAVGHDTFTGVFAAVGSGFADVYNATGYGNGAFNQFEGQGGDDTITGNGNTQIRFDGASASVTVNLGLGTASGNASVGHDTITGGVNSVFGSGFADSLTGSNGNDILNGGNGNDTLVGTGGSDSLFGGGGADNFLYVVASDSTVASHDTINDFSHAQGDTIDFTNIAGATAFQGMLADQGVNVAANSVGWVEDTVAHTTTVYVNTTNAAEAQGSAQMEIVLDGTGLGLTASDFHLH